MTDPKLDVENFEKAKKQLEDFFECVGDEGLDRDGLHIAWEVYKSGAAKMAEIKDAEIAALKQENERILLEERNNAYYELANDMEDLESEISELKQEVERLKAQNEHYEKELSLGRLLQCEKETIRAVASKLENHYEQKKKEYAPLSHDHMAAFMSCIKFLESLSLPVGVEEVKK